MISWPGIGVWVPGEGGNSSMTRICTVLFSIALSLPAAAHHAVGVAYDTDNLVTIEGDVTSVFWRNPHIVVTLERVLDNGEREVWKAESGSTNSLERLGIGPDVVQVGDRVSLMGAASRRGLTTMAAYTMTRDDGTEVPLWPQRAAGIGRDIVLAPISAEAQQQGASQAQGIFRVWSRTGTGLESFLPFTDAAIAARATFDPLADDPALQCIPPGMPGMMNNPYPIEFVDEGGRLTLRLEEWDGVRTIHMTDAASAGEQPATSYGYSSGRWEDNTLVVTTTRINESYFDDIGTPQSEDIEIVERFTLNDNEDRLEYRVVVTEPATFTEPATLAGTWFWKPGEEIKPFQCANPDE